MNDETLEARLFSRVGTKQGLRRRVEPDFALIHRELKRKHVTLQMAVSCVDGSVCARVDLSF